MYVTGAGYDYTFSYDPMGRFETIKPTGGSTAFQYYYNTASNETQRRNYLSNRQLDQFYGRDSLNRMSARYARQTNGPTFSAEHYTYDRMSRLTEVARAEDGKSDLFGYYWDSEMYWAQYGVDTDMPEGPEPDPDQDMPDTTDPWAGWQGDPEAEGVPPPADQGEPSPPPVGKEPDVPAERSVTYFLDRAGNRTNVVDTGVNKVYTPNILNQYTQAESVSVVNGGEHEISSFQGNTYIYRNDERLVQVTSGGNTYYLAYDALGRCVKRTLNGAITYYIYDGEKPILEYSGDAIVGRNVYGKWIDEILMRTDPAVNSGQPFYYQQDRNQNVTHLTNAVGAVIEKYKYDAFGKPTIYAPNGTERATSLYKNRFLFTGREYAATFGFYEYRARAYNPTLGRFMSEDPKGFDAGDYNLFRYCHNDPLDLTDPMGLTARDPQPGDHQLPGPVAANPQEIDKQFKHEVERFDAQKVEATRALDPKLRSVVPGSIKQMIEKLQKNPGQFSDPNSAKAATTQVIKAFLEGRIAVGPESLFKVKGNNPMATTPNAPRFLLVNPKFINPPGYTRTPTANVPSLLAHEGSHLTENPVPGYNTPAWHAAEDQAKQVQRQFDRAFGVNSFQGYDPDG
jgi:RHS repeat-associated protein